jgi:hypothetical protein
MKGNGRSFSTTQLDAFGNKPLPFPLPPPKKRGTQGPKWKENLRRKLTISCDVYVRGVVKKCGIDIQRKNKSNSNVRTDEQNKTFPAFERG